MACFKRKSAGNKHKRRMQEERRFSLVRGQWDERWRDRVVRGGGRRKRGKRQKNERGMAARR